MRFYSLRSCPNPLLILWETRITIEKDASFQQHLHCFLHITSHAIRAPYIRLWCGASLPFECAASCHWHQRPGQMGILHQVQSQHLAVEHLGLLWLCRGDEGNKIAVSEHFALLLLKYPEPNQWSSTSVQLKLSEISLDAMASAGAFVHDS